jgi:hypothetical protein
MILVLDRKAGTIGGGGVCIRVDTTGEVLKPWCRAALDQGYDLDGMHLEMWDRGADARTEPMMCVTVENAAGMLRQPKKREDKAA